jgi:hypothetical protein
LIPGASYETKRQEVLIYLGRLTKHCCINNCYYSSNKEKTSKKQVFWDGKNFIFLNSLATIAVLHSDVIASNYAELIDKYNKSIHGSKPVKLFTKKSKKKKDHAFGYWTIQESDGVYLQCYSSYDHRYNNGHYIYDPEPYHFKKECRTYIKDGVLIFDEVNEIGFKSKERELKEKRNYWVRNNIEYCDYIEHTGLKLWVELESGSKFELNNYGLIEPKSKQKEEDYDGYEEESDY